jgi:hypothetical protein
MPASIRMVQPELPQSSGCAGATSSLPAPEISTVPSRRTPTPNADKQSNVLWQSAAAEKLSSFVTPPANAPSIAYRCEMDLSPGSRTLPLMFRAGRTTRLLPLVIKVALFLS